MAELTGSIESIVEELEKNLNRHQERAKQAAERIKSGRYGPDWNTTKTELVEEREYNKGAVWGMTRAMDLLGALNALMYAELNKQRLPENCCTTCGAEQESRPRYCTTTDCGNRAKLLVKDKHGNEWPVCLGHLELTLTGVGESTVEAL